jgi:hypothetical protein
MKRPLSSTVEQSVSNGPIAVQLGGWAQVVQVRAIDVHPNADRLVIMRLNIGVDIVVGPHYEEKQLGVYIRPGCIIPGWLAEDLWMIKKGDRWVEVESRVIRGVESPGLFAGSRWRNAPDREWQAWPLWRSRWKLGYDVTAYLGIRGAP